jgi:3-dehydroquinate synthase
VTRIEVALGERSYPILIGGGLLDTASEHLKPFARDGRLVVVSDENVWNALGSRFRAALGGIEAVPIIVAPGEGSKSWLELEHLTERLIALGIERSDHIVAFGGGMIGDLAGFAAAITKRGCSYIQIPTTLLAQVDSSVGGKTAINAGGGKNMVGAFHQPSLVLIDPETLQTLPERELRAGHAEIVKYGLINDPAFFAWCEANGAALLSGDRKAQLYAIETSVRAKGDIVARDERETNGSRALLNFGHTFAHALEAEAGLSGALLHGEAVAIGMVLAFRFSAGRGLCSWEDAERVAALLRGAGLPVEIPSSIDPMRLAGHMIRDKKNMAGRLTFILTRGIGRAFVDTSVGIKEVERFLCAELS